MKRVTVQIKDGRVSADFAGFAGNKCDELAKQIHPESMVEDEKTLKPEYHYNMQAMTQDNKQSY